MVKSSFELCAFAKLNDFLEMADEELSDEIRNDLIQHLQDLKRSFRDYFPLPDSNKVGSGIHSTNVGVNTIKLHWKKTALWSFRVTLL